jgi:hypothetical protein
MDPPGEGQRRQLVTAHLLRHLLRSPRYVKAWRGHASRPTQDIHQAAVAEVIALHLWDSGAWPETDKDLPRRLKDTVSRALNGKALSAQTLSWFIDAFEMSDDDAAALWTARTGLDPASSVPVVVGAGRAPPLRPSPHQTLSLHELHTVGPTGTPVEHRTIQVVRATAPMDRYTFRCDTSAVTVEVVRGGTAEPPRSEGNGLVGVDIVLPRPMSPGDVSAFEFRTVLDYEQRPAPELRRAAYRRTTNVEIGVRFHPGCLPVAAWASDWDNHDDPVPLRAVQVRLDSELSLHRFAAVLENATIGFTWAF